MSIPFRSFISGITAVSPYVDSQAVERQHIAVVTTFRMKLQSPGGGVICRHSLYGNAVAQSSDQRKKHLSQQRLQYQSQPQEDSNDGRSNSSNHALRRETQLGKCSESKRYTSQCLQRRHGPRLRSHHPNLPRQSRYLRR